MPLVTAHGNELLQGIRTVNADGTFDVLLADYARQAGWVCDQPWDNGDVVWVVIGDPPDPSENAMVEEQDNSQMPRLTVPGATLTVQPRHEGWMVSASWLSAPVWVAASDAPPAMHWQLSSGQVVLHLVVPLSLAPGEVRTLTLRWPLELRMDGVAETYRPRLRQTLLGPVDGGRILPSILADTVVDGAPVEAYEAVLHVVVRNASPRPVLVRRFPIQESELTLAELDGRLHCGSVDVTLYDETQATAKTAPLSLVPDRVLYAPDDRNRTLGMRWLVDATRRSSGYQQ